MKQLSNLPVNIQGKTSLLPLKNHSMAGHSERCLQLVKIKSAKDSVRCLKHSGRCHSMICSNLKLQSTTMWQRLCSKSFKAKVASTKLHPNSLQAIADICESKGILLIVDEVQTGIGRTGTRYAYEQTNLKPDIMTLAKGLGGGFPIGAMLGTSALYDTFGPGTHGTTFGGNPLAVAVAQTVVDHVFQDEFLRK